VKLSIVRLFGLGFKMYLYSFAILYAKTKNNQNREGKIIFKYFTVILILTNQFHGTDCEWWKEKILESNLNFKITKMAKLVNETKN